MATAVQMEGFDSFYSILDVAPTASQAEIKKAYRVAAIKSHPDKGGNADTFRAVAEAYKVLSNDQTRATYDRYGRAGIRSDSGLGSNSGHRTWAPGTSPQDIFREMFGDQVDLRHCFARWSYKRRAAAIRTLTIGWNGVSASATASSCAITPAASALPGGPR